MSHDSSDSSEVAGYRIDGQGSITGKETKGFWLRLVPYTFGLSD